MGKLARLNKQLRENARFPTPERATTDDLMAFLTEIEFQYNPEFLKAIVGFHSSAKQSGNKDAVIGIFPQDCDRSTGEITEVKFGSYSLGKMLQCCNNPFEYKHIEDLRLRKSSKIVVECVRKYVGRIEFYPIFFSSINWLWGENHPLLKFRPQQVATCAEAFWLLRDSSGYQLVHCSEMEEDLEYYQTSLAHSSTF